MSPTEGANRRRSERVMLQIPILVKTDSAEHEHFEEETHTLVVNAHGGLVKLEMEVEIWKFNCCINTGAKGNCGQAPSSNRNKSLLCALCPS